MIDEDTTVVTTGGIAVHRDSMLVDRPLPACLCGDWDDEQLTAQTWADVREDVLDDESKTKLCEQTRCFPAAELRTP